MHPFEVSDIQRTVIIVGLSKAGAVYVRVVVVCLSHAPHSFAGQSLLEAPQKVVCFEVVIYTGVS